jgi:broad specificity phosphatase PhoE
VQVVPGTRLVLVRHGETEANVNQVWHGALDAPLTARGQAQVSATAEHLAHLHLASPFQVFYVSPLARARSTAAAITVAIGLEPQIVEELREFDLGDWEGRSFRELHDEEDLWGRWAVTPDFAPPNGESPVSFSQRATQALTTLAVRHPGARILVVSHGGFISNVLAAWLGDHPGDWRSFDPHNCAVTVLVRQAGAWQGEVVNDIAHLPSSARADYLPEY